MTDLEALKAASDSLKACLAGDREECAREIVRSANLAGLMITSSAPNHRAFDQTKCAEAIVCAMYELTWHGTKPNPIRLRGAFEEAILQATAPVRSVPS